LSRSCRESELTEPGTRPAAEKLQGNQRATFQLKGAGCYQKENRLVVSAMRWFCGATRRERVQIDAHLRHFFPTLSSFCCS
jgi:hypothetical protein